MNTEQGREYLNDMHRRFHEYRIQQANASDDVNGNKRSGNEELYAIIEEQRQIIEQQKRLIEEQALQNQMQQNQQALQQQLIDSLVATKRLKPN
jgi:hypothetical protein